MESFILASASPRRREILTLLGLTYEVIPAQGEEKWDATLSAKQAVCEIARGKAQEIADRYPQRLVIGADTVVMIDGEILGKPRDEADARRMLQQLQGRQHQVLTAVWVCSPNGGEGFVEQAEVSFYPMNDTDIEEYIATGEPMDKAGAYGIQGMGLRYVQGIQGDFYTVMGLPAARLWRFLKRFE